MNWTTYYTRLIPMVDSVPLQARDLSSAKVIETRLVGAVKGRYRRLQLEDGRRISTIEVPLENTLTEPTTETEKE